MNKIKYTKEEKAFIKKWGYLLDSDYDTVRKVINPITGKRVSCLELAKINQRGLEKNIAHKKLKNIK